MALESSAPALDGVTSDEAGLLAVQYQAVRRCTEQLCQPLATEDYVVQSMERTLARSPFQLTLGARASMLT